MHDVSSMYVRIYRYILALFVSTINTTYGMHVRSHTVLSLVWPTVSLAVQVYRLPHWLSSNHTYSTGRRLLAVAACKKKISVKLLIGWCASAQCCAVPCRACTVQQMAPNVRGQPVTQPVLPIMMCIFSCFLHSRPNNTRLLKKVHTTELITGS